MINFKFSITIFNDIYDIGASYWIHDWRHFKLFCCNFTIDSFFSLTDKIWFIRLRTSKNPDDSSWLIFPLFLLLLLLFIRKIKNIYLLLYDYIFITIIVIYMWITFYLLKVQRLKLVPVQLLKIQV